MGRAGASADQRRGASTFVPFRAGVWVGAWRLPTEPWTFVVGEDGRIAERFEGAVSVRELQAAVDKVAPRG